MNIIISFVFLGLAYLFFTRKRRKITWKVRLFIISIVAITVFCTVPLTLYYAATHPIYTMAYGMKMTIAYHRIRGDITQAIELINGRVGRYIPTPAKRIAKTLKGMYRRYQIETNIQYARAVVGR